ncbi:MAG: asparagine synthase (glutamine-hydrolyzing) [Verrucomicrobia bacterium]|nr:asparagine synthase (glutamine-hydrolyzing) [Verrucomicrobiota bacterium]MDA1067780.1 asparagine synthase (glutamine-hydrolyzing) [Verrucomicrobiota bacterium]
MCGIAGEFSFKQAPSDADWNHLGQLMDRRGPDGKGRWDDPGFATFIFRRLAILDLSEKGNQPMTTRDGRHVIVYNGELYNFQKLREELIAKGEVFFSGSDTEVVLKSLVTWGKEAFHKFNGMFALAFYDRLEKKLLLARDHAGMKPLYFLTNTKGIFFASQYDQVLAHPWSKSCTVSAEALRLYMSLAYIPAPYAILNDSQMIEPGSWVEIDHTGRIETKKWYSFPIPNEEGNPNFEEALTELDEALNSAVKRHLISDVPVAAFLSGGIDSPMIASTIRNITKGVVQTFTMGTDSPQSDESADAMRYAESLGLNQSIYKITTEDSIHLLDDVIDSCGEPFGDISMFPSLAISNFVSNDYKVVLSGDGGDELFWGYPERANKIMRLCEYYRCPFALRYLYKRLVGNLGDQTKFTPSTQRTLGDTFRSVHSHLSEYWLNNIFIDFPKWPSGYSAFKYGGWKKTPSANFIKKCEFESHLPMVLLKMDRASMHHSLENRIPFLDREVITAASKFSWEACLDLDTMTGKIPLRKLLKRRTNFQSTKKKGFGVPMDDWLRTSLRPLFEELVLSRDNILGLEISKPQMKALFSEHCERKADHSWGLWPLLSLTIWEKKFLS